jgi:hypothetical protein
MGFNVKVSTREFQHFIIIFIFLFVCETVISQPPIVIENEKCLKFHLRIIWQKRFPFHFLFYCQRHLKIVGKFKAMF